MNQRLSLTTITLASALILLSGLLVPKPSAGQASEPDDMAINGRVYTSLQVDNTIYLGGEFDYTGVSRQNFALLSATDGQAAASPAFDQSIQQVLADGQGGWLARGSFTKVGEAARDGLARIRADGTLDPSWNPSLSGWLDTMVRSGSTLYLGGQLTAVNGQARSGLAAIDAISGALKSWAPNLGGPITAMLVHEGKLYVAISSAQKNSIRAFDAASGQATSLQIDTEPGQILTMAIVGQTLYLGGSFSWGTDADPYRFENIAALDLASGQPKPITLSAIHSHGEGLDLAVSGNTLYLAGAFIAVNGQPRHSIAAIDTTTHTLTAWNPDVIDRVIDIEIVGQQLYMVGAFERIFGQKRDNLAVIDLPSGQLTSYRGSATNQINSVAVQNGVVALGGFITQAGGVICRGIVSIDAVSGAPRQWCPSLLMHVDDPFPQTNPRVSALAVEGETIYMGGIFGAIGSSNRQGLAAANRTSGAALPWSPQHNGAQINGMASGAGKIFVSGSFTMIGGASRQGLAALDLSSGATLPWNPNLDIAAADLITFEGGRLYVGIANAASSRLVVLDATTSGTIWSTPASRPIGAILPLGDKLFIGGSFTSVAGQQRSGLATLNKADGSLASWAPQLSGANLSVFGLASYNGLIYVSGWFSSAGGQPRSNAAAFDASSGALAPWSPRANPVALQVVVNSSTIYLITGNYLPSPGPAVSIQRYSLDSPGSTATATRTTTASPSPTCTPTATATATRTATASATRTSTPSATRTAGPTATATRTSTPTLTPRAGQQLWLPQVKGAARQAGGC